MATTTPILIRILGDSDSARRAMRDLDNSFDNTERRLKTLGSSLTKLGAVNALGGLTGQAAALVAALAPAAGALLAIPAAAATAGAAVGTLAVGFSGLSAAFQETSTGAGAAAVDTTSLQRAIEAASRGISSARKDVERSTRAVAESEDDLVDAEYDLRQAQLDAKSAQYALNEARDAAADRIAAYGDKLKSASLNEERAEIALIDAKARLAEVTKDSESTALDLRKAQLGVAEAEQNQRELIASNTRLREENNEAQKAGVEGSKEVTDANAKVADSQDKIRDAADGVAEAQQGIRDANESLSESLLQVVLAEQQLADAQAALARSGASAAGAVDKQAEAMAKLAPNARAVVETILGLEGQWNALRRTVQQQLFAGVAEDIQRLAGVSFPTLTKGMGGVAAAFNGVIRSSIAAMATPLFQGNLAKIFGASAEMTTKLGSSFGPLIVGLSNLAVAGLPIIQRFNDFITKGLLAAGSMLNTQEGINKLTASMYRGADALSLIWSIAKNLGGTLINVFRGADSGNILKSLDEITAKMRAWSGSMEGQNTFGQVFASLSTMFTNLVGVLSTALPVVGKIFGAFNSLPAPVKDAAGQFAAWAIVLGPVIKLMVAASLGIKGIIGVLSAFRTIATVAWGAATAAANSNLITTIRVWLMYQVESVKAMASMLAAKVAVVGHWVAMGAAAMAGALRTAAAWLIAMGPIGLVIAAVLAVVALIVTNFDTIKRAIGLAWDWVSEKTSQAWSWVQEKIDSFVSWVSAIPGRIRKYLSNVWDFYTAATALVWDWVKEKASGVVDWFKELPGRISANVANMWDGLKESFKSALNWVIDKWNGFKLDLKFPDNVFGVPLGPLAGKGFTLDTPDIPRFAKGGIAPANRPILVGENEPEIITLGRTSRVYNQRQAAAAGMMGGGTTYSPTYNITISGNGDASLYRAFEEMLEAHLEEARQVMAAGAR